ncbi:3'(2'),5'-bisphosphate nucleotidase CysQ [Aliagarivorans marinus]|uniref:3'(2'),5'-bisphosphate nucleotidase CysQ n=1 Tax=Aliagarivorans marinus TaxID=561965 RepID=UPI001FE1191C|nr:3'(2'),5'-bisphosphate nucleotidase CysQ [Aliagarivorans marinus]
MNNQQHDLAQSLLSSACEIAEQAGDLINSIYQQGDYQSEWKSDSTPVTSADYAAHHFLLEQLEKLTPDIPILSEEHAAIPLEKRAHWSRYWLVDPLDGTQEFVSGSGDFATELALVENNQPVLGVVYGPVVGKRYSAVKGHGASLRFQGKEQSIHSTHYATPPERIRVATSRVQNPALLQAILSGDFRYHLQPLGSASLKSCLVAEGLADCYIRIGPTGEWDTGAPQIILQEAGGDLFDLQLQALSYNQRESLENPNFISLGDASLPWHEILKRNH